jgi:PleD family two-component response regulator
VTISLGAAIRADGEHPLALLKRADEALYSAKEQGRDRVVVAK